MNCKILFLTVIIFFSSCIKSDDLVTLPNVLEKKALFGNDEYIPFSYHQTTLLNDGSLLIKETRPSNSTSRLMRYDIQSDTLSILKGSIYGDLRDFMTKTSVYDNKICFIDWNNELVVVDLENQFLTESIPINSLGSNHIKKENKLYFNSDTRHIVELDLNSKELKNKYFLDNSTQDEKYRFEWAIHQPENTEPALLIIDQLDDTHHSLIKLDLKTETIIWNNELTEFTLNSQYNSSKVLTQRSNVFVKSKDYISCRDISTGKLIWSVETKLSESNYPINIFNNLIVNMTENYITAYNINDGSIAWETKNNPLGVNWYSSSVQMVRSGDYLIINQMLLDLNTGKEKWSTNTSITKDQLYINFNTPALDEINKKIYWVIDDSILTVALE